FPRCSRPRPPRPRWPAPSNQLEPARCPSHEPLRPGWRPVWEARRVPSSYVLRRMTYGPMRRRTAMTGITMEELALAARNHGMALEALRYDLHPVALHALLIHSDIPAADETTWRLEVGGRVKRHRALNVWALARARAATS